MRASMTLLFALFLTRCVSYKLTGENENLNQGTFEAYDTGFVGQYGYESESFLFPNGTTKIVGSEREEIHMDTGIWTKYNPNVLYAHGIGLGLDDQVEMVCPAQNGRFCRSESYNHLCDSRSGTCWCSKGYEGLDCSRCTSDYHSVDRVVEFLGLGYCADVEALELPHVNVDPLSGSLCNTLCETIEECKGLSLLTNVQDNTVPSGCRLYVSKSESEEVLLRHVYDYLDTFFGWMERNHLTNFTTVTSHLSNWTYADERLTREKKQFRGRVFELASLYTASFVCAQEGEICECPQGGLIRYGTESKWTSWNPIDNTGSIECSDSSMHEEDPAPGEIKSCECRVGLDVTWSIPENATRTNDAQKRNIVKYIVRENEDGSFDTTRECYKKMDVCSKKERCVNKCSGGGTCNYETGQCECFEYRTGEDCSKTLCETFSPFCESCTKSACIKCRDSYALVNETSCVSCASRYDPRCVDCDASQCLKCGDSLLNSVRRSGRRNVDDMLLLTLPDETRRELSVTLPFGTQRPEYFADVESDYVLLPELESLNASAMHCTQKTTFSTGGGFHSWWKCVPVDDSHMISNLVCGHLGTISFSSPTYQVREQDHNIAITVTRTGGGYGTVSVRYAVKHLTTDYNDLSFVETNWIPESLYDDDDVGLSREYHEAHSETLTLTFLPGVTRMTFHITIFDDVELEDNERFQIFLHDPSDGANVGSQSSAIVTILDDEANRVSTKLSSLSGLGLSQGVAGQTSEISISLKNPLGHEIVSLPDDEYLELHMSTLYTDGESPKNVLSDAAYLTTRQMYLGGSETWAWQRPAKPILSPLSQTNTPSPGLYVDERFPSLDPPAGIDNTWERYRCADDNTCEFVPRYAGTYLLHVSLAKTRGLLGEYFDNAFLEGTPVMTRRDRQILFHWGHGLITPRARNFVSVRWSGQIVNPFAESRFTFHVTADDHVRFWLDHRLLVDAWDNASPNTTRSRSIVLLEGWHDIRLEYRDVGGNAFVALEYESREFPRTPVPEEAFRSLHTFESAPFEVDVEPDDFDPRSTLASGEALSKMNVGESYDIELLARDRFGNERGANYASQDTFTIVADLREGADFTQIHPTAVTGDSYYDESKQRHILPVQTNLAGEYAMDVVGLDPETGQQVPVFGGHSFGVDARPGHTDPSMCVVWGDAVRASEIGNMGVVTAGESAMFELESRDTMSNKLRDEGDEFEIVLLHSETSHAVRGHAVGSYDHSAEYEIRFVPEIAGPSLLSLRCASCSGAGHVAGSPFPIFVFPGSPVPSKSTAHGDATMRAVEAVPATFRVNVRDVHSNHLLDYPEFSESRWTNVSRLSLNLTVDITSTGPASNIEYVGNGSFDVTYVARGSGTQFMSVRLNGDHIKDSPFKIDITDGATIAEFSQASYQGTTDVIATVPASLRLRLADGSNNTRTTTREIAEQALAVDPYRVHEFLGQHITIEARDILNESSVVMVANLVEVRFTDKENERFNACELLLRNDIGVWSGESVKYRSRCVDNSNSSDSSSSSSRIDIQEEDSRVPLVFDVLYTFDIAGDYILNISVQDQNQERRYLEDLPSRTRVYPDISDAFLSDIQDCDRFGVAGTPANMIVTLRDRDSNTQVQRGGTPRALIRCNLLNVSESGREDRRYDSKLFEYRGHVPLRSDTKFHTVSDMSTISLCVDQCASSSTCEAFEYVARFKTCRLHTSSFATVLGENVDEDIITYVRSSSSTRMGAGLLGAPIPSQFELVSDFTESSTEQLHETYEFEEWNGKLETVWTPTTSGKWRCDPTLRYAGGLEAHYFHNLASYERAVVIPEFASSHDGEDGSVFAAFRRIDTSVNFTWGRTPFPENRWNDQDLEWDGWAVRWDGYLEAKFSETHTVEIVTSTHDRVQLWIDDNLEIDTTNKKTTRHRCSVELQAGVLVPLRLDLSDVQDETLISLYWSSPSSPQLKLVDSNSMWYENRVDNSSFQVHVTSASTDPALSVAYAVPTRTNATGYDDEIYHALSHVVVGETWEFVVQARDLFGNHRTQGGDDLVVTLHHREFPDIRIHGEVEDLSDGRYRVMYVPFIAGEYVMGVTFAESSWPIYDVENATKSSSERALDLSISNLRTMSIGRHVDESPYAITAIATTCHGESTVLSGDDASKGVAGETHRFDVLLRDRFKNPCIRANVQAQLWHKERALNTPFAVIDGIVNNDETSVINVEYKALISGSYDLRVTLISGMEDVHTETQVVTGSWTPLEISPAPVTEASMSTLQGLPDQVNVNASYDLKITSRDRFGNIRRNDEIEDWYGVIFDGVSIQRQEVEYTAADSDGNYALQLVPEIPDSSQPNEDTYDYLLRVYLGQNRGLRVRYYQSVDVENVDEPNRGGGVVSVDYGRTWGTKGHASGVWSYMTRINAEQELEKSVGWLSSEIVDRAEWNRTTGSVIRFDAFFLAPTKELYTFTVHGIDSSSKDRVSVVLDDNTWILEDTTRTGTVKLERGGMYFIRVEWQRVDSDGDDDALVSVKWSTPTRPDSVVLGSENRFVADVSDIQGSPFAVQLNP